jgi:flagellar biosynthesis protein FlhG
MSDQAAGLRGLVGQPRTPRPPLRVIAVTSGKGGVGKTHVSANLAVLAAKAGR